MSKTRVLGLSGLGPATGRVLGLAGLGSAAGRVLGLAGLGSAAGRQRGARRVSRCCLLTQSCLTLCDPRDRSPPGSSVRGIS